MILDGDSMIDFFQTINVKRFVFADGDNLSNPKVFIDFLNEQKYLELNSQIICFIGANKNQNNWYNTAVKYIKSFDKKTSFNLTPIRIFSEGNNALDMVLSSYVGLAMGQNSRAEFIIVSNDKGYDSVVEHFSSLGVQIKRIPIYNAAKNDKEKSSKSKSANADLSLELIKNLKEQILQINNKKRPQKIAALKNVLKNLGRKDMTDKNVDNITNQIIEELEKENKLSVKNQRLEWE